MDNVWRLVAPDGSVRELIVRPWKGIGSEIYYEAKFTDRWSSGVGETQIEAVTKLAESCKRFLGEIVPPGERSRAELLAATSDQWRPGEPSVEDVKNHLARHRFGENEPAEALWQVKFTLVTGPRIESTTVWLDPYTGQPWCWLWGISLPIADHHFRDQFWRPLTASGDPCARETT